MSRIITKSDAQAEVSKRLDRARQAATRVTPTVRSTGTTATQGIRNARAWAAPRIEQGISDARGWVAPRIERGVHDARGWAAPRIEQAGRALEETVAPKVSGMLTATARRVDPSSASSSGRRWLRILTGVALVAALGGIIAAIARKRSAKLPGEATLDDEPAAAEAEQPDAGESEQIMVEAEIGVNGKGPTA